MSWWACRCEAVRHCRWVDEVVSDAQWVIDEEFLKKYDIDYVAHDEDPYISAGHEDVYALVKRLGTSNIFPSQYPFDFSFLCVDRSLYSNPSDTGRVYIGAAGADSALL